jgi:hypothetical protein
VTHFHQNGKIIDEEKRRDESREKTNKRKKMRS